MPVDNWLILALIMIFSSIILCGLLPMVVRLLIARKRYRRYLAELQDIELTTPDAFFILQSIEQTSHSNSLENINYHEHSLLYSYIPFIDDVTREDDTYV